MLHGRSSVLFKTYSSIHIYQIKNAILKCHHLQAGILFCVLYIYLDNMTNLNDLSNRNIDVILYNPITQGVNLFMVHQTFGNINTNV